MNETETQTPLTCPKCGLPTEAVIPDELDRLVSLCCWSTIPGSEKAHPLNGVTLVKCATPRCSNGVRASKAVYCDDCIRRQASVNPEAMPETPRRRWTGGD
jgi:hypothetical protein